MDNENLNLKRCLVLQSFAPLFLLLFIKHIDLSLYCKLIYSFFELLINNGITSFRFKPAELTFAAPFEQAEYIYSLIDSEE